MKGNDGFYADNIDECSDNVKYKTKAKFTSKILKFLFGAPFPFEEYYESGAKHWIVSAISKTP